MDEVKIQIALSNKNLPGFPKYINHGCTRWGHQWIAMQKLGPTLKELLKQQQSIQKDRNYFSRRTIIQIGAQMLARLEALHTLGWLHLDIKPDNIMIGTDDMTNRESSTLYLIDFGVAQTFLDDSYCHIEEKDVDMFVGSTMFASVRAFEGKQQSRRDDLISLAYLLSYLMNNC